MPIKFPEGAQFCVTMKHACDFECAEADDDYFAFALKPQGLVFKKFYKTEKEVEAVLAKRPFGYNAFVWDRSGECVNGAY